MKQKKTTNNIKLSIWFILGGFFVFFIIIGRISYLSLSKTVDGIDLQKFASKRTTKTDTLVAKRGSILDTNGEVLAQNVSSYTIVAYLSESRTTDSKKPQHVVDKEKTASELSKILDIDYETLLNYLKKENVYQTELGSKGKGLTELTKEKIENLNLPGIGFIETQKRNYPYGKFLSYTLGYAKVRQTTVDGKEEDKIVGELGIESKYDKELSGVDGYTFYQKDRNGYKIAGTNEITEESKDGYDIQLTVDATIQLFVEQALTKATKKYSSDWVTIMVADGETGAILASSTSPSFDPNKRDITNYLDTNVSLAYEPGSTMKIFSYMAAMENGTYKGSDKFTSGVYVTKDGTKIRDWNRTGWGKISYDRGFALSSNVGVINLIKKNMNRDILMNYYKKLGFGEKTNIELANEVSGKIDFKYETEILNAGFGQGITTTPIQNIKALTSISNDGVLLQPYIIKKITDPNTGKTIYEGSKKELERVASESTVNKIKDLMEDVVTGNSSNSTGYYYYMKGYDLIAKTGTAQVAKENGKGYSDKVIRGFAGMFPKNDPKVIIYAAAKNPSSSKLLKILIKDVVKNTSNYLNIYNESQKNEKKVSKINLDCYTGKNVDEVKNNLSKNKISTIILGNGDKIIGQYPEKGTEVSELDKVYLQTNSKNIIVPSFIGLSKSEVMIIANMLKLDIEYNGIGYVTKQSIKENTIYKNEKIVLDLKEKK